MESSVTVYTACVGEADFLKCNSDCDVSVSHCVPAHETRRVTASRLCGGLNELRISFKNPITGVIDMVRCDDEDLCFFDQLPSKPVSREFKLRKATGGSVLLYDSCSTWLAETGLQQLKDGIRVKRFLDYYDKLTVTYPDQKKRIVRQIQLSAMECVLFAAVEGVRGSVKTPRTYDQRVKELASVPGSVSDLAGAIAVLYRDLASILHLDPPRMCEAFARKYIRMVMNGERTNRYLHPRAEWSDEMLLVRGVWDNLYR